MRTFFIRITGCGETAFRYIMSFLAFKKANNAEGLVLFKHKLPIVKSNLMSKSIVLSSILFADVLYILEM